MTKDRLMTNAFGRRSDRSLSLVPLQDHAPSWADPSDSLPLTTQALSVSYDGKPAILGVDLAVAQGRMTAIVGPNGAGKSTLLKACLDVLPRLSGEVRFFGRPLAQSRQRIAYVPQRASVDWDFPASVADVVLMGLYRQTGLLARITRAQRDAVEAALDRVGMADFAARQIGQLSGGQQQRVFLARALVQNADLYILDEPFAGVDAATEAAIVTILHMLRDGGRSVLAVHHDLSTLRGYFDDVILLNQKCIAAGPIAQVLTETALQTTFGGRLGALGGAALTG